MTVRKKPPTRARKGATTPRARAKQKPRPRKVAQQDAFLKAYAECGIISKACEAAGIDRRRHWEWSQEDAYKERFEDAHAQALDVIRAEIFRRGVEGVKEPVFGKKPGLHSGSGVVGHIKKYDSRLLEILAKSKMPEFRDRLAIGGDPDLGPVQHEDMSAEAATAEYRSKLKRKG